MLLCKRPDKPAEFDDAIKEAKAKIQKLIDDNEVLMATHFGAIPDSFKDIFGNHQDNRCGYCDTLLNNCIGELDHFRPKTELEELSDDPTTWGDEVPHRRPRVRNRHAVRSIKPGYWWLAYEWDNLVYSCERCNGPFKRCFFPVAEGASRQWPPQKDGPEETPLLLHCYGTENPSKHLIFNENGSVEAVEGSRHGWETIKTCGLDKHTLRIRRLTLVPRVFDLIAQIGEHGFDVPRGKRALLDLLALGNPKDHDMPGIVRIIAEQLFEKSWEQLEKYAF